MNSYFACDHLKEQKKKLVCWYFNIFQNYSPKCHSSAVTQGLKPMQGAQYRNQRCSSGQKRRWNLTFSILGLLFFFLIKYCFFQNRGVLQHLLLGNFNHLIYQIFPDRDMWSSLARWSCFCGTEGSFIFLFI